MTARLSGLSPAERSLVRAAVARLYALGVRIRDVAALCPGLSLPTIKRAVAPARIGRVPRPPRALSDEARALLTLDWCTQIVRGYDRAPRATGRPFAESYCPVHVWGQARGAEGPAPGARPDVQAVAFLAASGRLGLPEPALTAESSCAQTVRLYRMALACCAAGPPVCLSSLLRLGLWLEAWPGVDALVIVEFLQAEVSPRRWWVRRCPRCGALGAGPAPAQVVCLRCSPARPAAPADAPRCGTAPADDPRPTVADARAEVLRCVARRLARRARLCPCPPRP